MLSDEELDEIFDNDWNNAVDAFAGGETDDEFQNNLREMVRSLQRSAYMRGGLADEEDMTITASMGSDQSRRLLLAMLSGVPMTIKIKQFE